MTAMSRSATTYLDRDQIRALVQASDGRGFLSLVTTWSLIAAAFALVPFASGHPLAWVACIVLLGGRQLALAILMHECAHRSLFRTRALNDVLGVALCAAPVWQRLDAYRQHHLGHHAHTGVEGDPDLGLVEPFPTTRAGLARKLLRDLTGIAFLRRVVGTLAMDAGFYTYSASTGQQRVDPPPPLGAIVAGLARHTGPTVLANLTLYAVLRAFGHGELFVAWVVANAIPFSLFLRLRSIAEHAVTERSPDPFLNTRTTHAGLLARLTVAPHHVNYHLEHHLLPTVPHYRLPEFHALLRKAGAYEEAKFATGYADVLRLAASA